jgi:hypothetical protein
MLNDDVRLPEVLPVLSRGKHRHPRKGACFMEFASYLAGERWSDHPACTHPLLATVARLVNDYTTDGRRQRLAPLIPSVIGLTSDDLRVDALIALRCALIALPVVAAERQNVMAVSVLTCNRVLADLDGRPASWTGEESREVLALAPHATRWAERYVHGTSISHRAFQAYGAPSAVRYAVDGVAYACVPEPDAALHDLLAAAIRECALVVGRAAEPVPAQPEYHVA